MLAAAAAAAAAATTTAAGHLFCLESEDLSTQLSLRGILISGIYSHTSS